MKNIAMALGYLYREMPTMNLENIYTPLLIDLLIFNNFSSSYNIYFATRILRVIGRQSVRLYDSIR